MKRLLLLLFIGMSLCSLSQPSKPKWVNFYSKKRVNCIVPEGDNMWIGTQQGGIYQTDLNGKILASYDKNNGLMANKINCIAIDEQGNKWIGTENGLIELSNKTLTNYTTINGLKSNSVRSIAIDNKGNKWMGRI